MEVELRMYETEEGTVPFSQRMDRMEGKPIYGIVMSRLDRVEQGNLGDHRSVGNGVVELKIDFGPGYRVYLGQDGRELVILLVGGDKSTQSRDIRMAKKYWKTYNA